MNFDVCILTIFTDNDHQTPLCRKEDRDFRYIDEDQWINGHFPKSLPNTDILEVSVNQKSGIQNYTMGLCL